MTCTRLGLALLSTTAFVTTTAMAQDAVDNATLLDEIRIEDVGAQAILGNNEITEEDIEQRNPMTTKDVFAGESAITASGGAPIGQKVFVNGIEESLLAVTIDGARQNKSAFHHTGNVLLDPSLLKSVEISAGLAPADAGPSGVAGSIAYTLKDGRDLLEPGENFGAITTLGTGDNGTGLRTTISLFGQEGAFDYLISGTRISGNDYKDGSGATIGGTEVELTDLVAKLGVTTQTGSRFSLSASQTEDTGMRMGQAGPGGIIFIRPDFFNVVGTENVLVEGLSRRTSVTATYEHNAYGDLFNPTAQISMNEQEIDAVGVYGVNTSLSGFIKNEFSLGNGTLVAGLDFFDESARGEGRGPGPFGSEGREEHKNIGIFAQARQDLGERVSVSYGARYDWQDFEGADDTTFKDSGLSANGTVDVILTDTLTLNAGVASTWGGYELGEAALVNFGGGWTYDGLKASSARSGRIGLRFDNGNWQLGAALFHTEVTDINAVLPSGGDRGATADLTSRGVDATIGYSWHSGFARLNYTYADVELDENVIGTTAYYLGRPVGHIIAAEAGWQVNDQWRIGGNAQIALDNNSTSTPLDGYSILNAYAVFKPTKVEGLEVRLDVHNLFDETYVARSSDGIDSTRVIPLNEPGRTIGLTATLRF